MITRPAERLAVAPLTRARELAFVLACWILAAVPVMLSHLFFDAREPLLAAALSAVAVFSAAGVYQSLCSRHRGVSHALGAGVIWLLLAVAGEMYATSVHREWYLLLGSPAHPLLRNLFLFVWIFAPATFAHACDEED